MILFMKKQEAFFKEMQFERALLHVKECGEQFLYPFIDKLVNHQRL